MRRNETIADAKKKNGLKDEKRNNKIELFLEILIESSNYFLFCWRLPSSHVDSRTPIAA